MKPKTLILMVVAVSCGLGASYMTSRLLADRNQDVEKVPVLIAKKMLSNGDTIKVPEEMFVEKFFPKGDEPKLALADAESLKGRVLKRSLRPGDFITADDLLDDKDRTMGGSLPQGHQAVGIRVNPESIAGGFASLPHSRVNIISTVRKGNEKDSYAKILLENVLVLAADTQTRVNENGQAMPANVVTVALKPHDVLKLELAKTQGTISLALRGLNDNTLSEVTSITAEQLRTGQSNTGDEPVQESSPSPPAAVPLVPKVEPKVVTPTIVVTKDAPPGTVHTLVVYDGDKQQKFDYRIDENGRPINPNQRRPAASPSVPGQQPAPAPKKDAAPDGGN